MLALSQACGYVTIVGCTFFAGPAAELYRPASSALIGDLVAPEQRVLVWTTGEMIYAPASSAYVTNLAPDRLRGRYHGLYVMAYSVGLLLGPAVGTAVFESSETALWIACGVSGVFAAALARIRPATVGD